ncbi:MAG: hypothetical protein IMF04_00165 [Proteobacteria bacterium]|nr:hypothetical protein [Pseudomonadota bacterium]
MNGTLSKVMKWGDQLVSVGATVRYWAESSRNGPEGFAGRLSLTLLFPK